MTQETAIATAADYADALLTARRAKSSLALLVLLLIVLQIALFFVAKYTDLVPVSTTPGAPVVSASATASGSTISATINMAPTTMGATNTAAPKTPSSSKMLHQDLIQYGVGLCAFVGVTATIVLSLVLFLITAIMLVGRLIGVSRLTSAFIWSVILLVLLFPWQAFLAGPTFNDPSFKVPGVLYTWEELRQNAKLGVVGDHPDVLHLVLHWARFVAWPLAAAIITVAVQIKSNRGLREALGEVDPDLAALPPTV